MNTAYLDCVNKTLKVEIVGETFTIQLEGDKVESGTVRTKQGNYITRFDFSDKIPQFSVVKDNAVEDYLQKGNFDSLLTNRVDFTVSVDKGSREDYIGVSFPNGFISYMETYGVMMREAPESPQYDKWTSKQGSIYMLEVIRGWALEFETQHINTDWEEEETDWDEQVIEFLNLKLRN
jgi:hypothetical protein